MKIPAKGKAQVPHPASGFGLGEDESEVADHRPNFATLDGARLTF